MPLSLKPLGPLESICLCRALGEAKVKEQCKGSDLVFGSVVLPLSGMDGGETGFLDNIFAAAAAFDPSVLPEEAKLFPSAAAFNGVRELEKSLVEDTPRQIVNALALRGAAYFVWQLISYASKWFGGDVVKAAAAITVDGAPARWPSGFRRWWCSKVLAA